MQVWTILYNLRVILRGIKFDLKYKVPWFFKSLIATPFFLIKFKKYKGQNNIYTHIRVHFGDNLTHIHYLRLLAINNSSYTFHHFAKESYLSDLAYYTRDIKNIFYYDLDYCPFYSIDAWKNYNRFFEKHKEKQDFVKLYIDFFDFFSNKLNINSPIKSKTDLIFDSTLFYDKSILLPQYDWLIVNSLPLSGQFKLDIKKMDAFCIEISKKCNIITTRKVDNLPCTVDFGMSLCDIAALSMNCKYHLMVSTGPSWLVLNTFNCANSKGIFLLLDSEMVKFSNNMFVYKSLEEFLKFFGESIKLGM